MQKTKAWSRPKAARSGRALLMATGVRLQGSVRHVAKADKACGKANRDYKPLVK
jgi:hypothetical protein